MSNVVTSRPVKKLRDIKVPTRFYQRHKTGFEVLDQVFGGDSPGVLPGASYIVTGMPGAGKTTLTLQMADAFAQMGLKVLYNAGEQSLYMVKMAADRIKLQGDFEIQAIKEVNDLILFTTDHKFDIVIQDSINSIKDDEFPTVRNHIPSVTKKLIGMSVDFTMTTFLVSHVTKDGSVRGSNELVHDADAHLHLSLSKDTGNRVFELTKNRFGPAGVPYEFVLTADGIDLRKAADGTEQSTARNSDRKELLLSTIKELLLAGKKLSGYSHEDEPEIQKLGISGGAMRAALRMSSKQLESQGVTIMTETIDRREHTFVQQQTKE